MAKMTEQDKMTKWLDRLVKHYKDAFNVCRFNDTISTCAPYFDGVHIYEGIERIADVMGIKLVRKVRGDGEYPIELSFKYKNTRFYQICSDDEKDV